MDLFPSVPLNSLPLSLPALLLLSPPTSLHSLPLPPLRPPPPPLHTAGTLPQVPQPNAARFPPRLLRSTRAAPPPPTPPPPPAQIHTTHRPRYRRRRCPPRRSRDPASPLGRAWRRGQCRRGEAARRPVLFLRQALGRGGVAAAATRGGTRRRPACRRLPCRPRGTRPPIPPRARPLEGEKKGKFEFLSSNQDAPARMLLDPRSDSAYGEANPGRRAATPSLIKPPYSPAHRTTPLSSLLPDPFQLVAASSY